MVFLIFISMSEFLPFQDEGESIPITFGGAYYRSIHSLARAPDGSFFLVVNASNHMLDNAVLRLSPEGELIATVDEKGSGPGELGTPIGIRVQGNHVFVGDLTRSVVHVYDTDLNFIRDIHMRQGGKLVFVTEQMIGLWGPNERGMFVHNLVTYRHDMDEIKPEPRYLRAYPAEQMPFLVHSMGGATVMTDGRYAAVMPTRYQVYLIDPEGEEEEIFKREPSHILPYRDYEGDRQHMDHKTREWMDSFTKFLGIFAHRDTIYLLHGAATSEKEFYLDAFDLQGRFHFRKHRPKIAPKILVDGVFYGTSTSKTEEGDHLFSIHWERLP